MNRIMMLIGGAALVGVVGFAVWFFLQPAVPSEPGVTAKAETLDISVFQDQSFSRLRAAQVPNPPVQRGRGNPFSPPARIAPIVVSPDPGTLIPEPPVVETTPVTP